MEGGVYGELESTIPPVTCPAWPCMFTGRNPGKIGMYSFISVEAGGEFRIKIRSSSDYHRWSLWKILNDSGISVGLFNVAMTFPPHKIDSFMVCGTGSPLSGRTNYTYPERIKQELERAVPGYEVLPPIVATIKGKEEDYKSILEQAVTNRLKAARYLIKTFPWQLFVGVFFSIDTAQHYFWHHMDMHHPWHKGEEYRDVIKNLYKRIDSAIGELIEELPEETDVLIVSDHGFQTCHKVFVVSKWLEKEGFLVFSNPVGGGNETPWIWHLRDFLLSILGARMARMIARIVPERLAAKISSRGKFGYQVARLYRNIDWARTRAYPDAGTNMIRINLKGREPGGIVEPGPEYDALVDDIGNRLKSFTDPAMGKRLDITVFKKHELYHGDYAELGPDIAFHINKYMPVAGGNQKCEWAEPAFSGWHARQGVFMAYGPRIKESGEKLVNLRIYDITPTVLHMFGLPVSNDMDGRVLTEIFKKDSDLARRSVTYESAGEKLRIKGKVTKLKETDTI